MANRYWVGGTGNWSDTARWSTSDGGASGASVPGIADSVFFTASSNSGTNAFTVTVDTGAVRNCLNFTASGLDGVMTLDGTATLQIYGDLSLPSSNFTWSHTGTLILFGNVNGGTKGINFNGNTCTASTIRFDFGGLTTFTHRLDAALTATQNVNLREGDLALSGFTVTCAAFSADGADNKSITFGSGGNIVLTGTGTVWNYSGSNLTISDQNNCSITLTNTTATGRTFAGGGLTYGTLTIGGSTGTSTLTISGSNTFSSVASTKTVAHTISFTDGTTQTVGAWTVKGTSGNVVTLQGTSTAGWNLAYSGSYRVEGLDYLSISRSTATPSDTWYAGENSTNGGNNSGWLFVQDPDDFLIFFPSELEYGSS